MESDQKAIADLTQKRQELETAQSRQPLDEQKLQSKQRELDEQLAANAKQEASMAPVSNTQLLQIRLNDATVENKHLKAVIEALKTQSIPMLAAVEAGLVTLKSDLEDNKDDDEHYDLCFQNFSQDLRNAVQGVEDTVHGTQSDDAFRIIPLKSFELRAKVQELGDEAVSSIKSGDTLAKNASVHEMTQMVRRARRTIAKGQTKIGNVVNWSASYLADRYPLTVTTAFMHGIATNYAVS